MLEFWHQKRALPDLSSGLEVKNNLPVVLKGKVRVCTFLMIFCIITQSLPKIPSRVPVASTNTSLICMPHTPPSKTLHKHNPHHNLTCNPKPKTPPYIRLFHNDLEGPNGQTEAATILQINVPSS